MAKAKRGFRGFFKERKRSWKIQGTVGPEHHFVEYQCPMCKRWFSSYYGYSFNTQGVRLHITKAAKNEAIAKSLGEMKNTPHFLFWKKNTQPINTPYRSREWSIA